MSPDLRTNRPLAESTGNEPKVGVLHGLGSRLPWAGRLVLAVAALGISTSAIPQSASAWQIQPGSIDPQCPTRTISRVEYHPTEEAPEGEEDEVQVNPPRRYATVWRDVVNCRDETIISFPSITVGYMPVLTEAATESEDSTH